MPELEEENALMVHRITARLGLGALAAVLAMGAAGAFPVSYNLNDYGYVTPVKDQSSCGSCWCFGTMASIESALLMHGGWQEGGTPDLSENHLNHHHGFQPIPACQGGDYQMAAAYFARGSGPLREVDHPYNYNNPTPVDTTLRYYVKDVEWYDTPSEIKTAVMTKGVVSTCLYWGGGFYNSSYDAHYQPETDTHGPNHSVAIIGWNDNRQTQAGAGKPGAWLCKNSWGSGWSSDGYFWISYYDKHTAKHTTMGAVSFQGVGPRFHHNIYSHDELGWAGQHTAPYAVNAFTAGADEVLTHVGFYTLADAVGYEVRIYDSFAGGVLQGLLTEQTGTADYRGYHTLDLDSWVRLQQGDDFYVCPCLDNGLHAIDCTHWKDVVMGPDGTPMGGYTVTAYANPGESYYSLDGIGWSDLYDVNSSANFSIKALTQVGLPIPEPSALCLLALAAALSAPRRRR